MKKILQAILTIGFIALVLLILYVLFEEILKPSASVESIVLVLIGAAAVFASLDVLKNVFAGIMLLFERPFQIGDKIRNGEYLGQVIKIGLRSTKIMMHNDSIVTIPNSEIMNKSISNESNGRPDCQVTAEIFLPVDSDTDKIRQIAIEAAQVSRYIYLNKTITVLFFNELKEKKSYLKMMIMAYVIDTKYELQFRSDMTELVLKELLARNLISANDYS